MSTRKFLPPSSERSIDPTKLYTRFSLVGSTRTLEK